MEYTCSLMVVEAPGGAGVTVFGFAAGAGAVFGEKNPDGVEVETAPNGS